MPVNAYELLIFETNGDRRLTGAMTNILLPPEHRSVDETEWLCHATPFDWRDERTKDKYYAAFQHQIHNPKAVAVAVAVAAHSSKAEAEECHELATDTFVGSACQHQGWTAFDPPNFYIALKGAGDGLDYKDAATMTQVAHRIYNKAKEMAGPDFSGKLHLLVDGDWLKPKAFSAMAAHMMELFPDLHLHIVRTCATTHLKFLHNTSDDGKATVAKKETWYEFFMRIAPLSHQLADDRIRVWHAAPMPEGTCSGQRNTKFANLVVYIGGGLECEKEVGSLLIRPDPRRKRKIDVAEASVKTAKDSDSPVSSLVAANVVF